MDLKPNPHICSKCLGQGWHDSYCYICKKIITPRDGALHNTHHTTERTRPCSGCKGSGKLEDQLRQRFLPQPDISKQWGAELFREMTKNKMAAWFANRIDELTIETLCSTSTEESSTSSPSTSKPPTGKTTP